MPEQNSFIVMFKDAPSYNKYKDEVTKSGGKITNDYGALLGFSAVIPSSLLALMKAPSLGNNGITSIEADSVVTIQQQ